MRTKIVAAKILLYNNSL